MKPSLVEYDKIFKKKKKMEEIIKQPQKNINYYWIFFNGFGILVIIIGTAILYKRKKDKMKNKNKSNQKIIQFYHDINKSE